MDIKNMRRTIKAPFVRRSAATAAAVIAENAAATPSAYNANAAATSTVATSPSSSSPVLSSSPLAPSRSTLPPTKSLLSSPTATSSPSSPVPPPSPSHPPQNLQHQPSNPYVKGAEGRKEWNDRYMNMSRAMRNWQLAFAVLAAVVVIQTFFIGKLSTAAKIQPYVVETNNGVPYALKPVTGISNKDQLLVNYAVNQFVINAKTIIADTSAAKHLLDKVYAYSAANTMNVLQDFYAKNNPFDLASRYTVSVAIINSLPISKNTWQVIWKEARRQTSDGSLIGTTKWVGQFTCEFGEVNPKYLNDNPFGIYVTNVVWSKSQG
jgi:type IV secretion system protein TrbF